MMNFYYIFIDKKSGLSWYCQVFAKKKKQIFREAKFISVIQSVVDTKVQEIRTAESC